MQAERTAGADPSSRAGSCSHAAHAADPRTRCLAGAHGYSVPIALGAYTFGIRLGVELSVVCVILRRICAGRAYGPWWLYAGSALMLAEYLMLAVGTGMLGRAVRRLERHARVLRRMSELARGLTGLERDAALRR